MEHVTVTGAVNGRYVISDSRPDGALTLEPDTSIEAIRERTGTREPTAEEWAEFERDLRIAHRCCPQTAITDRRGVPRSASCDAL